MATTSFRMTQLCVLYAVLGPSRFLRSRVRRTRNVKAIRSNGSGGRGESFYAFPRNNLMSARCGCDNSHTQVHPEDVRILENSFLQKPPSMGIAIAVLRPPQLTSDLIPRQPQRRPTADSSAGDLSALELLCLMKDKGIRPQIGSTT